MAKVLFGALEALADGQPVGSGPTAMEDYEAQLDAWLELERAAIRAELQLMGQDQVESAPERVAKSNAAAKLRQEADALLNGILSGARRFPSA